VKEIASTITSKGQVTIPSEVRKHLRLKQGDKVAFVIEDEGKVELKLPTYPTVASLAGAAGTLPQPLSMERMLEIAREDELEHEYRSST
jgi:AbrB family looped-hinge helix DNA binding protein